MSPRPTWSRLERELEWAEEFHRSRPMPPSQAQVRARARAACEFGVASLRQVLIVEPPLVSQFRAELDRLLPLVIAAMPHRPRWYPASYLHAVTYPPDATLPEAVAHDLRDIYYGFESDLELEETPWYLVESQQAYWDEQHRERALRNHWEHTCRMAVHGDALSMSYREHAWEMVGGQWRLRPHILEAARELVEPKVLIATGPVSYINETHVDAAIRDGRLPAHPSGPNGSLSKITSADLAAAIQNYGIRLE